METQKIVFVNKQLNTRLAGLLRLPENFCLSNNYPAIDEALSRHHGRECLEPRGFDRGIQCRAAQ